MTFANDIDMLIIDKQSKRDFEMKAVIVKNNAKYFLVGHNTTELKSTVLICAFREALKIDPNTDKTKWIDENSITQPVFFTV